MCVGLVTSWSNFSLARNLGRMEVLNISKLYIYTKLALKFINERYLLRSFWSLMKQ